MANFSLVIVPAKVLTGGKHKVRVMVSHNGQTRYIPTDIIIDSISEFKEGRVVKRPDKDILNLRLKKICDKYFERYMELEFSNCLTCSQLVRTMPGVSNTGCRFFWDTFTQQEKTLLAIIGLVFLSGESPSPPSNF